MAYDQRLVGFNPCTPYLMDVSNDAEIKYWKMVAKRAHQKNMHKFVFASLLGGCISFSNYFLIQLELDLWIEIIDVHSVKFEFFLFLWGFSLKKKVWKPKMLFHWKIRKKWK
jgi:hypothetical protein